MQRIATVVVAVVLAVGGLVAAPATAAVPDPAAPPTAAPSCPTTLPGPRALVRLAYVALLRRCPDAAGAASWEAALRDGVPTAAMARRLAATPEARGIVVADAYATIVGRPPSAAERAYWAGWLRPAPDRARRHDQLLATLAGTPEVLTAAGATPGGFVDLLYARVLGRTPTAAERAYWVGRLGSAATTDRATVARVLVRLDEPQAGVIRAAWLEVLGTRPTAAQARDHVAAFRVDGDRGAVSARLVASATFARRADAGAQVVPGRYAALGDSYAVGEGNPPWVESTSDERCGWSRAAYPEVARTSSAAVPGTLEMAACSGASLTSLHTFDDGEGHSYPGQIAALAGGPAPSLVTLTIGGNDIGFVPIMEACLRVEIGGAQVSPYYDRARCELWLDWLAPAALAELRSGLTDGGRPMDCDGHRCTVAAAVAEVRAAAPGARVAVVGYPPLGPPSGACRGDLAFEDGRPALGGRWSIDPAHVAKGHSLVLQLNAVLRDAARQAGATYVDPVARFVGHTPCSADPWVNGLRVRRAAPGSVDPSSFHPNHRGGLALAAALVGSLGG